MQRQEIEVRDYDDTAKAEPEFFEAVMTHAMRHAHNAKSITVFCTPRVADDAPDYKHPQWIEYGISIQYLDSGKLFIGAIQRNKGAPVEFHT
jgi:hypothetical protein